MGINRVKKRGRSRIEVRRRWPDGSTFRRYFPTMTAARLVHAQIEAGIATGAWMDLREQLSREAPQEALTVSEFGALFMDQYVKPRLSSWKRYQITMNVLSKELGHLRLDRFRRRHLHAWVQRRASEVSAGTVNRDIAVIKKMFGYAWECGHIEENPLVRFPLLRCVEKARLVLEVTDFRRLVASIAEPTLAALIAVLGETGMRKQEGLYSRWEHVDAPSRVLAVEHTKNGKVRHVPLSRYALRHLGGLTRRLDNPYVFCNPRTGRRWINPEKIFKTAVEKAGFGWVGFHDLRRFRATQWVRQGIDVRTVKELLGHASIQTTMRYAQYVPSVLEEVRRIQDAEVENADSVGDIWETGT